MRGCSKISTANSESHVPCFQERVDTGTYVLSGCRGVSGLVPQPLCMKFKSAEADWNSSFVSHPHYRRKPAEKIAVDKIITGGVYCWRSDGQPGSIAPA